MTRSILRYIVYIALAVLATLLLLVGAIHLELFGPLPSKDQIRSYRNAYASRILSADGQVLGDVHSTYRLHIEDQAIPKHLKQALVAVEDQRFYAHSGIDIKGLMRALSKNVVLGNKSAGGGSTLSQQLVKNMFGRSGAQGGLYVSKIKEMILARRLEKVLTKDEILTLYLNTVPFGENLYGIEAASQRYFGKGTFALKMEEAAVLVGMLKANTTYHPRLNPEASLERRNLVLQLMTEQEVIPKVQADSLQQLPLALNYTITQAQFNGYLNQVVEDQARKILGQYNEEHGSSYALEADGLLIQTTIHAPLQQIGSQALYQHLETMQEKLQENYTVNRKRHLPPHILYRTSMDQDSLFRAVVALHGGLFSMDVRSGAVLAYVGGKDHNRYPYDQIQAERMMASTFKPFLYAAALEQGMHPCDYIENNSLIFEDHQDWEPRNYDRTEGGRYTLAAALARSLNIPAVRLYTQLNRSTLDSFWNGFNMGHPLPQKPAAALGTLDASVLQLSQAYSAFPNRGQKSTAYFIDRIISPSGDTLYEHQPSPAIQVCDQNTADQMCAMLQLSVKQGTATSLRSKFQLTHPLAAKTGTSQNYQDAWTIAFNKELLFAVRVGANDPDIHFNSGTYGASTKLALPILGQVLQQMQRQALMTPQLEAGFDADQDMDLDCEHYIEDGPIRRWINDWGGNRTTVEQEQSAEESGWSRFRERLREIF